MFLILLSFFFCFGELMIWLGAAVQKRHDCGWITYGDFVSIQTTLERTLFRFISLFSFSFSLDTSCGLHLRYYAVI